MKKLQCGQIKHTILWTFDEFLVVFLSYVSIIGEPDTGRVFYLMIMCKRRDLFFDSPFLENRISWKVVELRIFLEVLLKEMTVHSVEFAMSFGIFDSRGKLKF